MNKKNLEELLKPGPELDCTERERFVVSPQDQLNSYLAPIIRKRFGFGSCFIIFNGLEITGVFKIKRKKNKVIITDLAGADDNWPTIEAFFRMNKLEITDEETEELYSDIDEIENSVYTINK